MSQKRKYCRTAASTRRGRAPAAATQQLSATKQTKENKTDKANSDNAAKHPPERRDDGMDFIHLRGGFRCIHPVFIEELQDSKLNPSILFSSKSCKVFKLHPSVLCHSGARGFQLHPSILFSSKSCRVFSCIYPSFFHPRAGEFLFQPRAGGFPLHIHPSILFSSKICRVFTSIHPLFIKDLQGFQLHPCTLFSSKNW